MVDSVIHASRRKLIGWGKADGDIFMAADKKAFRYLMRTDSETVITEPLTQAECEAMKAKLNAKSAIKVLD